MTKRIAKLRKQALLDGNANGKLSTPRLKTWGWWFWPVSAVALATGTLWSTNHIESQIRNVAPDMLESAGYNTDGLQFAAEYRDVNVTGTLPVDVSAATIKSVLQNNAGSKGESIRTAYVTATADYKRAVEITPKESPRADIRVTANIDESGINILGVLPSQNHAATLQAATLLSFTQDRIENQIIVADQPASIENADRHINVFATLLSNLPPEVLDAQLNLDNELLTGTINVANMEAQQTLLALMPDSSVTVQVAPIKLTPYSAPVPINEIDSLQEEFSLLQDDIRQHVAFAPASDLLKESAYPVLNKLSVSLMKYPTPDIEIGGHTDSQSSEEYNLSLSERRAAAVADYLIQTGIPQSRLRAVGYGESQPIFSNDTAEGRAMNRRVEFKAM